MLTAILCLLFTAEPSSRSRPASSTMRFRCPRAGRRPTRLAERIRAAFPPGTDLKAGAEPLVDGSMVAFIVEADASPARPPRVTGMVNHGRGYDLVPIGETGLWARVELIPTDTKFAYAYTRRRPDVRPGHRRDAPVEVSPRVAANSPAGRTARRSR